MWKHCDYCCLLLANVVGQHLVLGWNVTNGKKQTKKSIQRTVWGPFTFNSLLSAKRILIRMWKLKIPLFNNRPYIQSPRTRSKTNALPTTNQLQLQFVLITDWIESRNWPPSPIIKTNWGERQDSWYLDNKVMLAIFFLNTVLIYQTL